MFTNTYLPHVGGVARSVNAFAEDLRAMGHRVLVVAPIFPDCERHDKNEPDVFRVPAIQEFNGSDFSMRIPVPFFIDEKLDEFKPDIIHSHHPYLLGDAAVRAAKRRNLAMVFTHHTLYEEYTHYVGGDSETMREFARRLSTEYANLCDRVVAPSQSIKTLIERRGVSIPVTEIPTGVDIGFFSSGNGSSFRKAHAIPESARVIGHLGRLAPEKNLDFLARAVADAMEELPGTVFLVAGDGPSRMDILDRFKTRGLEDRLVLCGTVTGGSLADAYDAMDLFVFASHSETQGMVLAEAMAAGLPVIAQDASGVREVVRDGYNGQLLSDTSSPEAFAEAVCRAFRKQGKFNEWKNGAGKTAEAFSRDVSAKKLTELYEDAFSDAAAKSETGFSDLDPWDAFAVSIQTEWDLISEKTRAFVEVVKQRVQD